MPHQCLSCGHTFAEGSSELLEGCPQCKGTRFFYTAKPIQEAERKELQARAQKDLREVVTDLLQEAAPQTAQALIDKADGDGWARLGPRDIRRLVKQAQAEQQATRKQTALRDEPADSPKRIRAAEEAWARLQDELGDDEEAPPDTVNIRAAGEYEIDVKALLQREPIVVHKDGAYLIHLPSLFQGKSR